jgi:hypothetical protein
MTTPSIELARGWIGRNMVDRDYHTIGKVVDIYLDNETGRPDWAVVRTGLFGLRSSFVPLAEATEVDDEVQVPHPRTQVKEAPASSRTVSCRRPRRPSCTAITGSTTTPWH